MISQIVTDWISPLLWWLIDMAWIALASFSLWRPGGIGSRLFFAGAVTSGLLSTFATIDQYQVLLGGGGFLGENEVIWVVFDAIWLLSTILVMAGIFMILVRAPGMMAAAGSHSRPLGADSSEPPLP